MSLHNFQDKLERAQLSSTVSALKTPEGLLLGAGATVGNGIEGWAPGALFVQTDNATLHTNVGSATTASWETVTSS